MSLAVPCPGSPQVDDRQESQSCAGRESDRPATSPWTSAFQKSPSQLSATGSHPREPRARPTRGVFTDLAMTPTPQFRQGDAHDTRLALPPQFWGMGKGE